LRLSLVPLLALVLWAACDRPSDDPVDTDAVDDTTPATGTATVYFESAPGVPGVGATVVFHAPDGSVVSVGITDAAGELSGDITEGGAVTVMNEATDLVTVFGVKPGDTVRFAGWGFPVASGVAKVRVAANPGAEEYLFAASCGAGYALDTTDPVDVSYAPECLDGLGNLDVYATASNYVGGSRAYTFALGIDPDADITLPTPWRTDWLKPSFSVNGAPDDAFRFSATVASRRGGRYFTSGSQSSVVVAGGGATAQPEVPNGFAEDTLTSVLVEYDIASWGQGLLHRVQEGPVPDDAVYDGADLPAPVRAFTMDVSDPTRPAFELTGGTPLDVGLLRVQYPGSKGSGSWDLVVPGDQTTVRFPALPEEMAPLGPAEGVVPNKLRVYRQRVDGLDAHTLLVGWNVLIRAEAATYYPDFTGGEDTRVNFPDF
jgi:hypothetical protein